MPRTVDSRQAQARVVTGVATAPPGSLRYPNRRWVRHTGLQGGLQRRCECDCGTHCTEGGGRACVGVMSIIYGAAYHCALCGDDLCSACYSAGYSHHRHRRNHVMEEIAPPPPALHSSPDLKALSSPPPSPRTVERLQGVRIVTYDSYETDVYDDQRDCLLYYNHNILATLAAPQASVREVMQRHRTARTDADELDPDASVDRRWRGHELDCIAVAYMPWLHGQLASDDDEKGGGSGAQQRLLLATMDVEANAVDWDWLTRQEQQQFPCFLVHPAQSHKSHVEFAQRNVCWDDCFTHAVERADSPGLHSSFKFHPLFRPEHTLPTLDQFITWLHAHCTHPLPLNRLLAQASTVRSAVGWVRRGARASQQLAVLVSCYGAALPLDELVPRMAEVADQMGRLVGAGGRFATLQDVDGAWCEQHIPSVERLVSAWMSAHPLHSARTQWLETRERELAALPLPSALRDTPPTPPPQSRELLNGSDPSGMVAEVDNTSFPSVVLGHSANVLLGAWEDDHNDLTRNVGLCCRMLLPAVARLLQRCGQHYDTRPSRTGGDSIGASSSSSDREAAQRSMSPLRASLLPPPPSV